MKKKNLSILLAGFLAAAPLMAGAQEPDVVVTLGQVGESAWFVQSLDPTDAGVAPTGSGNPNPTMSFRIGERYRLINNQSALHPFTIAAQGSPSDLLLRQGAATGTFESDPDVAWTNSPVSEMTFTMTPALADALFASGKDPVYFCEVHLEMEGAVGFLAQPSPFEWPSGQEFFENAPLGANLTDAFEGWSIVNGSGDYTALVSDEPSGADGEHVDSSRWLTVTDTDTENSNRIYPPAVITSESVAQYTFSWNMNVQSIGGAPFLLVSQHFNAPYTNLAGLEVTETGVNLILLGTDDGGIGKAGASETEAIYAFTDAGGFGQNEWVAVGFDVDFAAGEVRGHATGSDGTTHQMATIDGLDLQGGAEPDNFRWCIRNNAPGSVSVVSYDALVFQGVADTTSVGNWLIY